MKIRFLFFFTVLFYSFFQAPGLSSKAWGATFFINPGVAQTADGEVTSELVRGALVAMGHEIALTKEKAEFELRPTLLQLGSAYILKVEKFADGKSVYTSQMKATRAEDLDVVAKRVTRAVVQSKKVRESARMDDVTEGEQETPNRRESVRSVHFGFGPSLISGLNNNGAGYYFTLGYAWHLDQAAIRLKTALAGKGGALILDFGLAARYFFSQGDTSVFAGGEFGYAFARLETASLLSNDLTNGFLLGPQVGVQFFRTTTTQLEVALQWNMLLSETALGYPSYGTIRVGLFF